MKKRILIWLCLVALLVTSYTPVSVWAISELDAARDCRLTLHYTREGVAFPELEIQIFRVAECFPDGTFDLTGEFARYPVSIHGITTQKQWQDAASTLAAYVAADHRTPTATAVTDEKGTAEFQNLQTGLYLVLGVDAETKEATVHFGQTLILLPRPNELGTYEYALEARPKAGTLTPKTEYTVVKLWKDATDPKKRPNGVTVSILKDGVVQETVVLQASNNWSYTWYPQDIGGQWSVVETDVPDGYTVTITQNENTFTITNTLPGTPGNPPSTGNMHRLWPYVLAMSLSGCVMLLLGLWQKRKAV